MSVLPKIVSDDDEGLISNGSTGWGEKHWMEKDGWIEKTGL